jgi:hypothetical protein
VEWFKYIKVARQPDAVPEPPRADEVAAVTMRRELPDALLNVGWQPIQVDITRSHTVALRTTLDPTWRMGAGVDIQYDPMLLTPGHTSGQQYRELDRQHYRTASAAAFRVLVYVFLQVLTERLAKASGNRIPTVMLRFQTQGRAAPVTDGDTLIYAAAQTVEAALMRDTPVRMQGMVCTPGDSARQYRETGTAFALSSAFPLVMGMSTQSVVVPGTKRTASTVERVPVAPAAPKVALLVYSTRPCDERLPAVIRPHAIARGGEPRRIQESDTDRGGGGPPAPRRLRSYSADVQPFRQPAHQPIGAAAFPPHADGVPRRSRHQVPGGQALHAAPPVRGRAEVHLGHPAQTRHLAGHGGPSQPARVHPGRSSPACTPGPMAAHGPDRAVTARSW